MTQEIEEEKVADKEEAESPSFLEGVGLFACVIGALVVASYVIGWVFSKVPTPREDYCYYEIETRYTSVATGDRVSKRVFVDCPEGL